MKLNNNKQNNPQTDRQIDSERIFVREFCVFFSWEISQCNNRMSVCDRMVLNLEHTSFFVFDCYSKGGGTTTKI